MSEQLSLFHSSSVHSISIHRMVAIFYLTLYCEITFFVIASNTILLIILIKKYKEQKRSHKFITSMIVSDLCSGIVCIPFGIVLYYPEYEQKYVGYCFANITFIIIFRFNSLLIKLATAIDRYWAIVYPIHYYIHATDRKIQGMIGCAWVLSICLSLIAIPHQQPNACDFNSSYVFAVVYVLLPAIFLTLIFLCLRICCAMKNRKFKKNFELNATTLLLISIALACFLWIPSTIVYVLHQRDKFNEAKLYGYLSLYYAHPILNAILYGFAIKKQRNIFFKT